MTPGQRRLPDADFQRLVDEARTRHSLSDIIGRHTTLRRAGNQMKGLCPFHDERTPSFEVSDAKGYFYCHGCGAGGDAITFLREKEGRSFTDAMRILLGDDFPVIPPEERTKRLEAARAHEAEKIEMARAVWRSSRRAEGTLAETYLRLRGITIAPPPSVRFAMTPRWRDAETGEVGPNHPAVICGMQDVTGKLVAVQRIFLDRDGSKWSGAGKAKLTLGSFIGAAFRIGPDEPEHVIVPEGPEDGMTIAQDMPGAAVWTSCGTANLSRMVFPPCVRRVTLAGDNNSAGRKAVGEAASEYIGRGLEVGEAFPPAAFKDWNDQLRGLRQ